MSWNGFFKSWHQCVRAPQVTNAKVVRVWGRALVFVTHNTLVLSKLLTECLICCVCLCVTTKVQFSASWKANFVNFAFHFENNSAKELRNAYTKSLSEFNQREISTNFKSREIAFAFDDMWTFFFDRSVDCRYGKCSSLRAQWASNCSNLVDGLCFWLWCSFGVCVCVWQWGNEFAHLRFHCFVCSLFGVKASEEWRTWNGCATQADHQLVIVNCENVLKKRLLKGWDSDHRLFWSTVQYSSTQICSK
jgi:hypothetical protein